MDIDQIVDCHRTNVRQSLYLNRITVSQSELRKKTVVLEMIWYPMTKTPICAIFTSVELVTARWFIVCKRQVYYPCSIRWVRKSLHAYEKTGHQGVLISGYATNPKRCRNHLLLILRVTDIPVVLSSHA